MHPPDEAGKDQGVANNGRSDNYHAQQAEAVTADVTPHINQPQADTKPHKGGRESSNNGPVDVAPPERRSALETLTALLAAATFFGVIVQILLWQATKNADHHASEAENAALEVAKAAESEAEPAPDAGFSKVDNISSLYRMSMRIVNDGRSTAEGTIELTFFAMSSPLPPAHFSPPQSEGIYLPPTGSRLTNSLGDNRVFGPIVAQIGVDKPYLVAQLDFHYRSAQGKPLDFRLEHFWKFDPQGQLIETGDVPGGVGVLPQDGGH